MLWRFNDFPKLQKRFKYHLNRGFWWLGGVAEVARSHGVGGMALAGEAHEGGAGWPSPQLLVFALPAFRAPQMIFFLAKKSHHPMILLHPLQEIISPPLE